MPRRLLSFPLAGALALASSATLAGTPRTWESANGKFKTTAELVRLEADAVVLRNEKSKTITVPVAKLGQEDRDFVRLVRDSRFTIEGVGVISAIAEGTAWKLAGQQTVNGISATTYLCSSSPPGDNNVVLTVSGQVALNNDQRRAHIKGHFNGIANQITGLGLKATNSKRPVIEGEIPLVQEYWVEGKAATGVSIFAMGITIFQKERTLLFQALGTDRDALAKLLTASQTLTEE